MRHCIALSRIVGMPNGRVLPLALALEQNGIQRFINNNERPLLNYPFNRKGGGGKSQPVSYNGGIPFSKYKNKKNFKALKYAIYLPDNNFVKTKVENLVKIMNSKENRYGQNIKVLLGTKAITEGIDFKNIRQVHLLEPWYNNNRANQVIGRAVRNCSHKDLPLEERNVEVYKYGTMLEETEQEAADMYLYRNAER